MIKIKFKYNNNSKTLSVDEGQTIMEDAKKYNMGIEGSCEGSLACSTCHIIISKNWISKICPAKTEEKELLHILPDLQKNSRLGCQIKLTKNLDGIEIIIPN